MALSPVIQSQIEKISAAIADERQEFLNAVAPLSAEIAALKNAISELKLQVEAGSQAQETLEALEGTVVSALEQVVSEVEAIVEPAAE